MPDRLRIIFLVSIFWITIAAAQNEDEKWTLGPHLIISFPQSEFANLSKTGEGIGGKLLYHFPSVPFLRPRVDLAYLSYGEKRKSQTFSSGYYLVTTRNESFQLTLGPQFSVKAGAFTPYFAAMGGVYNYRTVTSIPEYYYYYGYPISETTSNLTRLGWNVNIGMLIDIGLGPFIDIGVKYQKINNAVETRIDEVTMKSDAEDLNVCIGVLFFLKN